MNPCWTPIIGQLAPWENWLNPSQSNWIVVLKTDVLLGTSRNLILAAAVKKHAKVDIKLFLPCPVSLDFSILSKIFAQDCLRKQIFDLSSAQSSSTLIFWHFVYYQSISPIFKENVKQVSCVKIPNLTVLCKQCFACSV